MSSVTPMTPDETLRLIQERAKASGDRFLVKVGRRKGYAGLFEHLATLGEATVEHIANPETWLPNFAGGGDYNMRVSHAEDLNTPIGAPLPVKLTGEPLMPRINALSSSGWQGPARLLYPLAEPATPTPAAQPPNMQVNPQLAGAGLPGSPGTFSVPPNPFTHPGYYPVHDERLAQERERLAEKERALSEMKLKQERENAAEKAELARKESEAKLRAEMDARSRELEAKLAAAAASGPKTTDLITALSSTLGPILMKMMDNQNAMRLEMMKVEAENRRAAAELAQKSAEQQQQMMLMLTKDKGVDPTVTTLIEVMRSNASGGAEMMSRVIDAMGVVSKTSVGMIESIADLRLGGEPENPVLQAVREGVKAMAALSKGAETGARKQVQAQKNLPKSPTQQLPPGQQAPQNGTQAQQVFERPDAPAAPNMPPASEAAPQQQQAFGDASTAPVKGLGQPVEGHVLSVLEAAIRDHHDPDEVADFFILALRLPETQAALKAANNDPNVLIAEKLGLAWVMVPANREYLEDLGAAVQEAGIEAGVIEAPADEGDEEAEQDAE